MDNFWYIFNIICNSPLFFLAYALMLRCFILTFYCLLIYGILQAVRKAFSGKMGIRISYYSWYTLLFCYPLSGLWWNNAVRLPLYNSFLNTSYIENWSMLISLQAASRAVTLLWFIIVLFKLFSRVITGLRIAKSISQMETYADKGSLKQQASEAVGLRRNHIRVVTSQAVQSPVSYGLFKKTILLPHDFDSRYSSTEQYLLMLHEMSHLKNHDTIKLHLISYLECFLWILPVFINFFKRDTEVLCDNRVIGLLNKPDIYGELLLKESVVKNQVNGVSFSDSYNTLQSRINALYAYHPVKRRLNVLCIIIYAVLLLTFCVSYGNHAEWLYVNDAYASSYTVRLSYLVGGDSSQPRDYTEQEHAEICKTSPFPSGFFDNGYEIIDGEIRFDKVALYETAAQFMNPDLLIDGVTLESTDSVWNTQLSDGIIRSETLTIYDNREPDDCSDMQLIEVIFESTIYTIDTRLSKTTILSEYAFDIHDLASADESNRYLTTPLEKRTLAETVYRIVAHWG